MKNTNSLFRDTFYHELIEHCVIHFKGKIYSKVQVIVSGIHKASRHTKMMRLTFLCIASKYN